MSGPYDEDILDAEMEIRAEGEIVSVSVEGTPVENADKPWLTEPAVDIEWEDVPVLYDRDGNSAFRAYIKGTDIPEGATLAYMPGNVKFTPTLKHRIHSPSRGDLKIDHVDVIAPGSQVILYVLRLVQ